MYTLNIQFNKDDLSLIYQAKQKIVLIQEIQNGLNQVIWSVFSPFENNQATWDDSFYVYASPSTAIENNLIEGISTKAASPQNTYTFNKELVFSDGKLNSNLSFTEYQAVNNVPYSQSPALTFGLAQSITTNNITNQAQPINAATVLSNQRATFTPKNTILIFLSSNLKENTVYNNISTANINSSSSIISTCLLLCNITLPRRHLIKIAGITALASSMPSIGFASESIALRVDFSSNKTITVKYFSNLGKFIQMQPI